jgi:hypothetical protein
MRSQSWKGCAAGVVFGVLVSVASASGQPLRGKPPGASPPGARAGEVREAMEQMVIARMKVALHLTEVQEATVIPRVQQLMQARGDHAAKRRAAMARLRALLLDETAGDREIEQGLRAVRGMDNDFHSKEEGLRDSIDRELTSRQRARMVFFEARLRRVMQRRLQDAMESARRPAAPPEEDDDQEPGPPGDGP